MEEESDVLVFAGDSQKQLQKTNIISGVGSYQVRHHLCYDLMGTGDHRSPGFEPRGSNVHHTVLSYVSLKGHS